MSLRARTTLQPAVEGAAWQAASLGSTWPHSGPSGLATQACSALSSTAAQPAAAWSARQTSIVGGAGGGAGVLGVLGAALASSTCSLSGLETLTAPLAMSVEPAVMVTSPVPELTLALAPMVSLSPW